MSLTLDLSDKLIITKLRRRIQEPQNIPISKVKIQCLNSDYWAGSGAVPSDHELRTIFAHIGHAFPSLKEIKMRVFELPLPVIALTTLLRLTKDTLQVIDMEDVVLQGSQEELEGLASTFQGHPALKKVNLDWCQPLTGSLEPVFHKFSTIKTLTQVQICGPILSVASLRVLFSNQSVKCLSLIDDGLHDDGMETITEALECPEQHIRELSLRLCGVDPTTAGKFARVLQHNQTLEKLEIRIKDTDWNSYGAAFADALKANNTLRKVTVFVDGSETNVDLVVEHLVSRALAHHPTLKSFRVCFRGVTNDTESNLIPNAFLGPAYSMLQTNTILEELKIDGVETLPHYISFLLKANKAGRHQLLQNPNSHSLWLKILIEQRQDVAFSNYLLSMNPALLPAYVAPRIIEV